MKGRLESLLRVRRVKERQRLGELGRVEGELDTAEREAARRRRERFAWAVPSGVPLDRAGLRRVQIEALALHDAEAAALADVAAVRHRRDQARERWSEARIELRSVERLAEHRAAVHAAEAAARAQAAADELALLTRGRP
jgi:flagellar export protein FliJ